MPPQNGYQRKQEESKLDHSFGTNAAEQNNAKKSYGDDEVDKVMTQIDEDIRIREFKKTPVSKKPVVKGSPQKEESNYRVNIMAQANFNDPASVQKIQSENQFQFKPEQEPEKKTKIVKDTSVVEITEGSPSRKSYLSEQQRKLMKQYISEGGENLTQQEFNEVMFELKQEFDERYQRNYRKELQEKEKTVVTTTTTNLNEFITEKSFGKVRLDVEIDKDNSMTFVGDGNVVIKSRGSSP